jgi:hypothetical protein
MHEQAQLATQKKLRSFLEQITVYTNGPGYPGNEFAPAREALRKHFKDLSRESTATRFVFDRIYRFIADQVPKGTQRPCSLKDTVGFEGIERLISQILEDANALPRKYRTLIYLPRAAPTGVQVLGVAENVALCETRYAGNWLQLPRPFQDTFGTAELSSADESSPGESRGARVYLRIDIDGYYYPSGKTANETIATAKQFVALGLANGLLKRNNVGARTDGAITSVISEEEAAVSVYDSQTLEIEDARKIAEPLHRLINYITVDVGKTVYSSAPTTFAITNDGVRQLLLKRCEPVTTCLNSSERFTDVLTGAEWLFDSYTADGETKKFLFAAIGLEAVLGSPPQEVTMRLADRLSYLVADNRDERAQIQEQFKRFYEHRSKIVHGTASILDDDQAASMHWGQRMLRRALQAELELLRKPPTSETGYFRVPRLD